MITQTAHITTLPGSFFEPSSCLSRDRDHDQIWSALADLIEYPRADWKVLIGSAEGVIQRQQPELSTMFREFRRDTKEVSLRTLQEAYLRSFDLNPDCALEVGYHLFTNDAKRRMFLADLLEAELPFDLGEDYQPPDYLPILLRLVPKLDNDDQRKEFIKLVMVPAVEKLVAALARTDGLYFGLLNVVRMFLMYAMGSFEGEIRYSEA